MKEYTIEITETLQKQLVVSAGSEEEAIKQVKHYYDTEQVVLDALDMVSVEINCIER